MNKINNLEEDDDGFMIDNIHDVSTNCFKKVIKK